MAPVSEQVPPTIEGKGINRGCGPRHAAPMSGRPTCAAPITRPTSVAVGGSNGTSSTHRRISPELPVVVMSVTGPCGLSSAPTRGNCGPRHRSAPAPPCRPCDSTPGMTPSLDRGMLACVSSASAAGQETGGVQWLAGSGGSPSSVSTSRLRFHCARWSARCRGSRQPGNGHRRGVNTGVAYVGSIGEGSDTEMTAMGDVVNVTARLSSVAGAGEFLVTSAAAAAAGLPDDLPRRRCN
jgi:hypothetical protein